MSTMMILIWCKELNGLVRRQFLPWTADTWCTVCGSPWGCFPSWWRGVSPSPWTRTPGRGPCRWPLDGHSGGGWCLGGFQTLSERQFPCKSEPFEKEVKKVEASPECPLSVCSVTKGVEYFLHGNNRRSFAVCCFPDNTVGALLCKHREVSLSLRP